MSEFKIFRPELELRRELGAEDDADRNKPISEEGPQKRDRTE